MSELDMSDRLNRLDNAILSGRLIRRTWTSQDAKGRELVCLLAALSPEAGEKGNARYCPASVMPQWLAYLTPWIDDSGSDDKWHGVVQRYASLAGRWHVLSEEQWHRLEYRIRADIVKSAKSYTENKNAISVCDEVIDLCERVADGFVVESEGFAVASSKAGMLQKAYYLAGSAASVASFAAVRCEPSGTFVTLAIDGRIFACQEATSRAADAAVGRRRMSTLEQADAIINNILNAIDNAIDNAITNA